MKFLTVGDPFWQRGAGGFGSLTRLVPWTLDDIPVAMRIGEWNAARAVVANGKVSSIPNRWPSSGPDMAQTVAANQPAYAMTNGYPAAAWSLTANNMSLIPTAAITPAWWLIVAQYGGGAADAMFPANAFPGLISDGASNVATRVSGNAGTTDLIASAWTGQASRNAGAYSAAILPLPMSMVEVRGAPISALWSVGRGDRGTDRGWRGTKWAWMALAMEPTGDLLARIQGRIAWDFGLQANLPAGHPYRNAQPMKTPGVMSVI